MGDLAISFASAGLPGEDPFDLEGDLLDGQFRVVKLVGEGELSVVYRGLHEGVSEPIAIKCLNLPETLDPKLVEPISESFREGARIHYRLAQGHLHIVQTLACGNTLAPRTGHVVPYMVREWLEGRSLSADFASRARASVRPRAPLEAVELLESAADALAYAHAEGVAHHSLNPLNLFLAKTRKGEVLKVLDFGMSRSLRAPGSGSARALQRSNSGLRLLFSSYAAPEQLDRRIGDPSTATDVFTFALVLFEAVAGRPYFPSGTHVSEVLRIASTREPLPRRAPGLALPRPLESVLSRALAPTPRERHANLRTFWTDVKDAVGRASSLGPAPRPSRASPPPLPIVSAPPKPPPVVTVVALTPPASVVALTPPAPVVASTPPAPVVAFPPPAPVVAFPSPRPLPQLAPSATPSSWTGEVARPVTTSSSFPSAPEATELAPDPCDGRETVPAPPPMHDRDHRGPPVGAWDPQLLLLRASRTLRALRGLDVRVPRFVGRYTVAPAQLGAVVASMVVTAVVVIVLVATASPRQTGASAAAPQTAPNVRMVHTVAPESTALVLSGAQARSPVVVRGFDRAATMRVLDEVAAGLESCIRRGSPRGPGSIRVFIHPNGTISSLFIGPPYVGTGTGLCISNRFLATRLPSFEGPLQALNYVFLTIPFN